MTDSTKPNIEEIYSVFQSHQIEIARIMTHCRASVWHLELERAREKFRLRLDEIGLAQHIDWGPSAQRTNLDYGNERNSESLGTVSTKED